MIGSFFFEKRLKWRDNVIKLDDEKGESMASGTLRFENVTKRYGEIVALDNVSFSVEGGEFFSLLGPSGCGKTTLLRIVAGFERPDSGKVYLDDQDITDLAPNKRPVNTVFQNYALFPHLTLYENIAFGLRVRKTPQAIVEKEVAKALEMIQMGEHAHKWPSQISGGQKQRIAIARALINRPGLLLLDEPLSALDLKLRQKMLMEIDLIHDEVGITFLFVTHDQTEAMSVSDRICVLNKGKIEQIGSPAELYETPKSSFVAAFIGDTNFLEGSVKSFISSEYSLLEIDGMPDVLCYNDKILTLGDNVYLSVRPEKIRITREKPTEHNHLNIFYGEVDNIVYKGDHTNFWVRVDEYRLSVAQQHSRFLLDEVPIEIEEKVWIWWHADDGYLLEKWVASDEALTQLPPEAVGEVEENNRE